MRNGRTFTPREIAEICGVPRWRVMYWLRNQYGWRSRGDDEYYSRWRLTTEQAEACIGHFVTEGIMEGYAIKWVPA